MKKTIQLLAAASLLNACAHTGNDPDAALKEQARQFSEAYFSYNFAKARQYVTPDSEKWLQFAASNLTQADIDLINATSQQLTVTPTQCTHLNDSASHVNVVLYNAVLKDNLEQPAHTAETADFTLTLIKRGDQYLVRMAGLPRPAK